MKAFSDLEQSKMLAEILPLESADMYYCYGMDIHTKKCDYDTVPTIIDADNQIDICDIPCWSLAALLDVLPVIIGDVLSKNSLRLRTDKSETNFNVWYDNLDSGMVEEGLDIIKSNSIDACYEMILKLHELNLL